MTALNGKLIVIEGLEGAGKSTAVHTVMNLLAERNIKAITTREPGGTPIGEILRTIFKNTEYKEVLDDRSELLLLYTARMQLVEQIIKPALHQGYWVVADRFELSTLAYQGGGRGLDHKVINTLSGFCLNGLKPDLTLFLDISPEVGMERAKLRGQFDRIEQLPIDFFKRVHEAYIENITTDPQCIIINAGLGIDEVQEQIKHALNDYLYSEHAQ